MLSILYVALVLLVVAGFYSGMGFALSYALGSMGIHAPWWAIATILFGVVAVGKAIVGGHDA